MFLAQHGASLCGINQRGRVHRQQEPVGDGTGGGLGDTVHIAVVRTVALL